MQKEKDQSLEANARPANVNFTIDLDFFVHLGLLTWDGAIKGTSRANAA
jgi:hypothetical protein